MQLTCKCGSTYFAQIVSFEKVSALRSQSGREELHPKPSFICAGCGGPLEAAIKASEAPATEKEPCIILGA